MLSIVLGILKVTGILLLILFGLILLLLLAVLFIPLRYQFEGEKTSREKYGAGGISWLLHGISLTGRYDSQGFRARLKLFGITVKRVGASEEKREAEEAGREGRKKESAEGEGTEREAGESRGTDGAASKEQDPGEEAVNGSSQEEAWKKLSGKPEPENGTEEYFKEDFSRTPLYPAEKKEKPGFEKQFHPIRSLKSFFRRIWQGITALWEFTVTLPNRVWEFWWKISELLDEGERKGEALRESWESLKKKAAPFLQQESRAVYKRLWGHIRYLMKAYGPRKIKGWIRVGTGEPDVTGELAGVFYLLLPACAQELEFQPEFQERILEGHVFIRGRIRGWCLVKVLFLLWRDRELRKLIRKVRAKGGQSNGR